MKQVENFKLNNSIPMFDTSLANFKEIIGKLVNLKDKINASLSNDNFCDIPLSVFAKQNSLNFIENLLAFNNFFHTIQTSTLIDYYSENTIDTKSEKFNDEIDIKSIFSPKRLNELFVKGEVQIDFSKEKLDFSLFSKLNKLSKVSASSDNVYIGYPFISCPQYLFGSSTQLLSVKPIANVTNSYKVFAPLFFWFASFEVDENNLVFTIKLQRDKNKMYQFTPNYLLILNRLLLNFNAETIAKFNSIIDLFSNVYSNLVSNKIKDANKFITPYEIIKNFFLKFLTTNIDDLSIDEIKTVLQENYLETSPVGLENKTATMKKIIDSAVFNPSSLFGTFDAYCSISNDFFNIFKQKNFNLDSKKESSKTKSSSSNKSITASLDSGSRVNYRIIPCGLIDSFDYVLCSFPIFDVLCKISLFHNNSSLIKKIFKTDINNISFIDFYKPDKSYVEFAKDSAYNMVCNPSFLNVVPLDYDQSKALNSIINSKSLVVNGPPGSGKSQVLTSILINSLYRNRRVALVSSNFYAAEVVKKRLGSFSAFCLDFFPRSTMSDQLNWLIFQTKILVFKILNFISSHSKLLSNHQFSVDTIKLRAWEIESLFAQVREIRNSFSYDVGKDVALTNNWYSSNTKKIIETFSLIAKFIKESSSSYEFWSLIENTTKMCDAFLHMYKSMSLYFSEQEIMLLLDSDFEFNKFNHTDFGSPLARKKLINLIRSKGAMINKTPLGNGYNQQSDDAKKPAQKSKNSNAESNVLISNNKLSTKNEYIKDFLKRLSFFVDIADSKVLSFLSSIAIESIEKRSSLWYAKYSMYVSSADYKNLLAFKKEFNPTNFEFDKYSELSYMLDFITKNAASISLDLHMQINNEIEDLFAKKTSADCKNLEFLFFTNVLNELIDRDLLGVLNSLASVVNYSNSSKLFKNTSHFLKMYSSILSVIFRIISASPKSVIDFFDLSIFWEGKYIFDSVFVDECSQLSASYLPILHALSNKLYLFGDDKQLSPRAWSTNIRLLNLIYSINFNMPTSSVDAYIKLMTSLYSLSTIYLASFTLSNHYRSSFSPLITYNNVAYYNNSLIPILENNVNRGDISESLKYIYVKPSSSGAYFSNELKKGIELVNAIYKKEIKDKNKPSILLVVNSIVSKNKILKLFAESNDPIFLECFFGYKPTCFVRLVPEVQGMQASNVILCCECDLSNIDKSTYIHSSSIGYFGKPNEGVNYLNVVTSRSLNSLTLIGTFIIPHNFDVKKNCGSLETSNFINYIYYCQNFTNLVSKKVKSDNSSIVQLMDDILMRSVLSTSCLLNDSYNVDDIKTDTAKHQAVKDYFDADFEWYTNEIKKYLSSLISSSDLKHMNLSIHTNVKIFKDFDIQFGLFSNKLNKYVLGIKLDDYNDDSASVGEFYSPENSIYFKYEFAKKFGWNLLRVSMLNWSTNAQNIKNNIRFEIDKFVKNMKKNKVAMR